jgi:hypothetical protein
MEPFPLPLRRRHHAAFWIIGVGLAFVFVVFGLEKFFLPANWIGWIPAWMNGLLGLDRYVWLKMIGGAEILTALLLLLPYRLVRRTGAAMATVQMVGVLTQTGWNDIAVRDIALLSMAVALWVLLGRD